jgi:hypothetical protein
MTVIEREVVETPITEREERARTLEAAALEIEVNGWNDDNGGHDGRLCILEAIAKASGEHPGLWASPEVTAAFTGSYSDFDCERLWRWNDRACRGGADAALVLRWRAEEIRDGR